jgi:sec-independent protein translocase protein TatB
VPGPAGPPPAATAENVPGLDAALAEPAGVSTVAVPPRPSPSPTITAPMPAIAPPASDPDRTA